MPDGTNDGTWHKDVCYAPCGRIRPDAFWLCVHTKPAQERRAMQAVREADFPVYLPLFVPRLPNRERRVVPIFPRYLFAQPNDAGQWVRLLHIPGVIDVIRRWPKGPPVHVPRPFVDSLLGQCAPSGVIEEYEPGPPKPRVGGDYRVLDGPFADLVGLCQRADKNRVWLLLRLLGRETTVELGRDAVEIVP